MKLYLFFVLHLASALPGGAVDARLTVGTVGNYAVKRNPSLAAARFRIEEARGRLLQSGRLTNPELELEFRRSHDYREHALGIAFMQKFPVTSRLRLEKAVSRAELAAAEAEVRDAERKLRAQVEISAVKLVALQQQRDLREKQLTNSREAAEATLKRAAVGEGSTVDATQFEVETHQLETERLQLDVERAGLLAELRPQLGLSAKDTLVISGALPEPAALPSSQPNVSDRPDVVAARHMAVAAAHSAALARENRYEDFEIGVLAEIGREEDEPEGLMTEGMAGVRLTLPLPFWNKNEGRIQETRAAAARAVKETDARIVEARGEAQGARAEMAALARVVNEMDDKLLPKARDLEGRLRQIYAAGQGTLTDTLRATERRLQLESRRLDAVRDYHLARVRYDAAVGKSRSNNSLSEQNSAKIIKSKTP